MDFSKQNGTTSVKVHQTPGGKSSFSLAWDAEPNQVVGKSKPVYVPQQNVLQANNVQTQNTNNVQTSVKVRAPPGGKSNFTLG
jgi:hypothetical protein